MSDAAFDRVVINPRERPISSDINQLQSVMARTLREFARGLFLPHSSTPDVVNTSFQPVSGFLGDAFFVAAGGALTHTVKAGLGFFYDPGSTATDIGGVSKVDDRSPYYPVYLSADQNISSPAAPGVGLERVDIIEVKLDRRLADSGNRDVLDVGTGVFTPTAVLKSLAYALDGRTGVVTTPTNSSAGLSLKAGSTQAAGTFAASNGVTGIPATSPGYVRIAVILVATTGVVAQGDVRDERYLLGMGGVHFGMEISQTPGVNDAFSIATNPPAHAGLRFAAHQLSPPGGAFNLFIFGGKIATNYGAVLLGQIKAVDVTKANRHCRMSTVSTGTITGAQRASLGAGAGNTGFTPAYGQEYVSVAIDGSHLVDPGDTNESVRVVSVIGMLTSK